jgi:hypothetical protein
MANAIMTNPFIGGGTPFSSLPYGVGGSMGGRIKNNSTGGLQMDIAEELRQAHMEYLQDAWDAHLVKGWYEYPKASIRTCVKSFMDMNKIDSFDVMNELLRTPRRKHQWHTCVTRFIAGYLPMLSNALWDGNLEIDALLKLLKATKMQTLLNPIDGKKQQAEKKEEVGAKKDADAYSALKRIRADARWETSKSNWRHCK